jgi:hypothetical protein
MDKIKVSGTDITILTQNDDDYISLTDMVAKQEEGSKLIEKWLTTKNTIEYLGVWEMLHNPNFKSPEFGGIRNEAGSNRFFMSVNQWVTKTNAIGIMAKPGRYGGTFAHKDIAFHFGMYISPKNSTMNNGQTPKELTVKEAIEQGYIYCSDETGEYNCRLDKLIPDEGMGLTSLFLAEKEPFFLTVEPSEIYEDLAENFAINAEVNDDDDNIGFLIRTVVDWQAVANVLNIALKAHPFYRPTKIKLIP